jgi:DNA mismatch repair protein MutL
MENIYLFAEHSQMLSGLGFDIAPFGTDTIVVNGVPEGYSAEAGKVQEMVGEMLQILSDDHGSLPELMTANLASKFASMGARGCDMLTNPAEAQRLIDSLFASENPEYTSQGRRIISIMSMEEIERKF